MVQVKNPAPTEDNACAALAIIAAYRKGAARQKDAAAAQKVLSR